jgi:hypothetical protein
VGTVRRSEAASSQVLSAYVCILSQILSPSLREVVLSEGSNHVMQVIDLALLPGVALALKERQFAHVRKVVFPPLFRDAFKGAKEYLKSELREWDRNGVLVFWEIRGYFARWM